MRIPHPLIIFLSAMFLLILASPAPSYAQASSCEPLKLAIEEKIRLNGVTNFSVTVMDADAVSTGRVVGTCQLGTKKLVYVQGDQPQAPSSPLGSASVPKVNPKPAREEIITECFDGRVYREGPCKK